MLEVHALPALSDNYIYLLRDSKSHKVVAIDPGDAKVVKKYLAKKNWQLHEIWNTHHHYDHTGGNLELKKEYSCKISGPHPGLKAIPGIDECLTEQNKLTLGDYQVRTIETPGHTAKALSFFVEDFNWLFCGDTLFSLGCGRLFEGTAKQLWTSLEKIKQLPEETKVYAAHEYTEQNCLFSLKVDPQNPDLKGKHKWIQKKSLNNEATLPSLLETELKTNPFLRTDNPGIKAATETQDKADWETFQVLREMKDNF